MNRKRKRFTAIVALLSVVAVLVSLLPGSLARAAETSFKYYDYTQKKTISYSGVTPTYIINGKTVNLSSIPAIINENGIALAACKTIFKNNSLSSYKYKSSDNSVKVSANGKTLVMYVGSKTAYLDGEPVTMNAAPVRIKYSESKKKTVMVPTRFVAETLGYYYNWNSQTSTITIKSPLKLRYDGEDVDYMGTQGLVTYNGKEVNLGKAPSIIISDNAMLRAKTVFRSAMGVSYTYNKNTGDITFKAGDITLELSLGSPYAYLNKKLVACPVAPKLIYNYKTRDEYIYVPGRFVAENLGYKYTWNSSAGVSIIEHTDMVGVPTDDDELISVTDPDTTINTGGSSSVEEKRFFIWDILPVMQDKVSTLLSASVDDIVTNEPGYTNVISDVRCDYDVSAGTEVYYIDFAMPVKELRHYLYNDKLVFELPSCYSSNVSYGFYRNFVDEIETMNDSTFGGTTVSFNFSSELLSYLIDVDYIGNTMKITFMHNYLTQLRAGINSAGEEYITFTGTGAIKGVTSHIDGTNYYSVTFSDLQNGLGAVDYYNDDSSASIKSYSLSDNSTDGTVTLYIETDGTKPYFTTDIGENEYTLRFSGDQASTGGTVSASEKLNIQLPPGVDKSMFTVEDLYYNEEILISIDGDYRSFYSGTTIVNTCESVLQVRVSYTPKNKTEIHICTNGVKGYKYEQNGDTLNFVIDRPANIYSKIIVLDAGHGGTDPGTVHRGYNEKDVNFSVIWDYCKPLFDDSDIKVYYSRYDDTLISLYDRAAYAENVDADMFISVHHNSSSNSSAKGSSVYYSTINPVVSPSGLTSKKMASIFLSALTNSLGTQNRGAIDKGFVVVRDNTVPSVLLEIGFMSNPSELALVVSDKFKAKVAETIFDTVERLFDSYPTGR